MLCVCVWLCVCLLASVTVCVLVFTCACVSSLTFILHVSPCLYPLYMNQGNWCTDVSSSPPFSADPELNYILNNTFWPEQYRWLEEIVSLIRLTVASIILVTRSKSFTWRESIKRWKWKWWCRERQRRKKDKARKKERKTKKERKIENNG